MNLPICGQIVIIDDEDLEKFLKHRWRIDKINYVFTCINRITGKTFLHRYLIDIQDGYVCDHINGNTLDNRKSNLRISSIAENSKNRKKSINGSSIYKGVSQYKTAGGVRWRAGITVNGKHSCLYFSDSEIECGLAYNIAAKILFGEYARLNDVGSFTSEEVYERVIFNLKFDKMIT